MAEYTAFYDTSGSRERLHSEAAIVTVGLLATTAQWAEFASDWSAVLAKHRVPFLHMRSLSPRFRGREPEQQAFLLDALNVVRSRVRMPFILSIIPREYAMVNAEFELDRFFTSPHACCVGSCALLVDRWFLGTIGAAGTDRVSHSHEKGENGIGQAMELARLHGARLLTLPSEASPAASSAFQAADMMSWVVRSFIEKVLRHADAPQISPVLEDLSFNLEKEIHMWGAEALRDLCEAQGVPRRHRDPGVPAGDC